MIYALSILLIILTGCKAKEPEQTAVSRAIDVIAVRGGTEPSGSGPNNVLTQTVQNGVAGINSAKNAAAKADQQISDDQNRADRVGQ